MGRKWNWMSGYSTPGFERMKAALSNWFEVPSPVLKNSHCAPIAALPIRL